MSSVEWSPTIKKVSQFNWNQTHTVPDGYASWDSLEVGSRKPKWYDAYKIGDFVSVKIDSCTSATLIGTAVGYGPTQKHHHG